MPNVKVVFSDQEIVAHLANNRVDVFEQVVKHYYPELFKFCLKFVRRKEVAEELVQDVFLYIWEKRHALVINISLKSYLYSSVKHRSINYLKLKYNQYTYDDEPLGVLVATHGNTDESLQYAELDQLIAQAVEALPDKCKIIFNLSRKGELTYREIAEQLHLSHKTVEGQMGIALKKIREYLQRYGIQLLIVFTTPLVYINLSAKIVYLI
jgi:RNA polymerase sigma-70 factor (ECF subfamily)